MSIADKLTQITENEQRVFNAGESKGYEKGYNEGINKGGYADGFSDGKQAEWDAFWDSFQQNGTRKSYAYAFAYGWDNAAFKPKYPLAPTSADHIFYDSKITEKGLREAMDRGITFDFSKANMTAFAFATMDELCEIPFDVSLEGLISATNGNGTFSYNPALKTIKRIIFGENTPISPTLFNQSPNIENITIGGTIGQSGFDASMCKNLSADSIKSIISHLSDTAQGKSLTLSQAAVDKANASGAFDGISANVHGAASWFPSAPVFTLPLNEGDAVKITLEVEDGHHYTDTSWGATLNPTDWFVGLSFGGEPYEREKIIRYGDGWAYDNTLRVNIWYATGGDVSFNYKVRAVRVYADGNEIDGENLYNIPEGTYSTGGVDDVEYEIKKTSVESLIANKNWTLNFG